MLRTRLEEQVSCLKWLSNTAESIEQTYYTRSAFLNDECKQKTLCMNPLPLASNTSEGQHTYTKRHDLRHVLATILFKQVPVYVCLQIRTTPFLKTKETFVARNERAVYHCDDTCS